MYELMLLEQKISFLFLQVQWSANRKMHLICGKEFIMMMSRFITLELFLCSDLLCAHWKFFATFFVMRNF